MKKLVLMLAVAFSVSLFSCNGGADADKTKDSIDSVTKADSIAKAEQTATDEADATQTPVEPQVENADSAQNL